MRILVCNVGSTSLKYKLFEMAGEAILCHGGIDGIGSASSRIRHSQAHQTIVDETRPISDQGMAIHWMTSLLLGSDAPAPGRVDSFDAIAFKVVGAEGISGAVMLDDRVLEAMESYTPLLPRHNPPYIDAIRHFRALAPDVPLVGLFETSFHAGLPEVAYTYGIPREWTEGLGIRRLGYHGASFTFIAERASRIVSPSNGDFRLVACHLGGSSSICAIRCAGR
ncbi:MAG: hypothetical protein RBS99_15075 [Rhodospirillales bacterium]|jgi:acetate kinase|nr:hypothetical protein [Rhodospirillales bacterium]